MSVKTKNVWICILSVLLIVSSFVMVMTSFSKVAAVVNDSVYYNYIENGDFEEEYSEWGVNGTTPERVAEGVDNHVGKLTSVGWVQARIWNASFMYDQLYKISFKLKFVSGDANATTSSAQFLARLTANDNSFLKEQYVEIGCNVEDSISLNEWHTFTYYLKVTDNRDETYSVFAGKNLSALNSLGTADIELTHFDLAVGCGNSGNLSEWYVDDYTMIPYGEYVGNLAENGNFEVEYDFSVVGGWGYSVQPERVEDEDGNHVGKISVTGGFWTGPRVWNASSMYGKTYRISFNMKLVSGDDSTVLGNGGQFLAALSSNDNAHIPDNTYIEIGANSGSTIGEWKAYSYYVRIEKGSSVDVLYTGTSAENLTKKMDCLSTDLSFINFLVGCGAPGNVVEFYLDDFAVTEVDGNLVENGGMTDVFATENQIEKWGTGSYASESMQRYWDADKNSYVIKNVGKGWMSARMLSSDLEFGKIYRMTAEIRVDSETSAMLPANMHFQFKLSDSESALYIADIGMMSGSLPVNVYHTAVGYFRLDKQDDGSLLFSYGKTKDTIAATNVVFADAAAFTHLDCQIGPGHDGTWYVDNVAVYNVSPKIYDASIEVFGENDEPLSDFSYEISGIYENASAEGNLLQVTGIDGEVSVLIKKDGYVGQTVVLSESKTLRVELVSAEQAYTAQLTIKDSQGNPVTDFTYEISGTGSYESAAVNENILTIDKVLGEIDVTIEKNLYVTVAVSVTETTAAQDVVFDKRAITEDPSDYTDELYSYNSFESIEVSEPAPSLNQFKLSTFINGPSASISVADTDSHFGTQSLRVNSVGDRLVFRMSRLQNESNFDLDKTYHAIFWMKGITENLTITPSVYISYFVEGDVMTSGANQFVDGLIPLGDNITLSTSEWTKLEIEFSVSVADGKLYLSSPYFEETKVFESSVAGKPIVDVGWFDLSLGARGEYYLDDVTFFNTYTAAVQILNADNEYITEGVTITATDFTGNTISIRPSVDSENKQFIYQNVYGVVSYTVELDGNVYKGSTSASNTSLLLAEPYTATVAVLDGEGREIGTELIYDIYAMDGASRIGGTWNDTLKAYTFEGAMGNLKVYVYAQGYEQHAFLTVERTNPQAEFRLKRIPSTADGLRGNTALNGDVESLSQLEMYQNREYAYPEVSNTGANDKWASFMPVLTLSDESAVGDKSLRISTSTAQLAQDDPEYAAFMAENGLEDKTFGDRVSYRAGNGYLLDGTTYCFTVYAKAPATQTAETKFTLVFLATINLCNGGQFFFWVPVDVTVTNAYWSKIEIYFSFELSDDEAAAAAGIYEYGRSKFTGTVKTYLNDSLILDRTGVYDYNVYKDGTYMFYAPDENGVMEGWGDFDTERHDGIEGQEGGRSFGSLSMVEPSFQILSGNSLLLDGGTITSKYTGEVSVLRKDLTPDSSVAYLRLTDKYTGEVIYLNASDYYDEIDQKYYIPDLYHSYDVNVCDADKNPVTGLAAQMISSEVPAVVIEYDYDIVLTVKDQNGQVVTDVVVRILLANGSYAEAVNNGDGTYSYSGLSGVRQISFRKVSGSQNSYTFPSGVTVSSANNVFDVQVTLKADETSDTQTDGNEDQEKTGCNSSVATAFVIPAAAVLLAGCIFVIYKKKD